jgi:hypothetical protein
MVSMRDYTMMAIDSSALPRGCPWLALVSDYLLPRDWHWVNKPGLSGKQDLKHPEKKKSSHPSLREPRGKFFFFWWGEGRIW